MPALIDGDTEVQRARWRAFATMVRIVTETLRGFGSGQALATAMLVRLILADLGEGHDGHRH